jgi:N-acetylglucosamine-6-sulfatase
MRYRVWVRKLLALAFAVGTLPYSQAATAPNIVFILVDDLDVDLFDKMPRLDSLLTQRGVRLDQHVVSISLCCPSRSATLRGQFAVNSGMYRNAMPGGGFQYFYEKGLEQSTLATWLQSSGYRTALFGKYLNEYPTGAPSANYIPPGWNEWYSPVDGTPYRSFNYTMNQNGAPVVYGKGSDDHITDVIARLSTDFIARSTAQAPDQPFFMYVAPYAPHAPATPPTRYTKAAPELAAPRTASFNEADVADKPAWVRAQPQLSSKRIAAIDSLYRDRYRSMLGVEDLVEKLLAALQAHGRLDNTYVFFASDNGYHQGQHRLDSGKNTAFEEDLRVPFVVRGPGLAAGRRVSQLTANVDYASTIAELAGVRPASFVDGRSLVPLLRTGAASTWRNALLLEHHPTVGADRNRVSGPVNATVEPADAFDTLATDERIGSFRGLRTADGFTYVEYDSGDRELYDLAADPFQLDNLYPRANQATKDKLSRWTRELSTGAGNGMRSTEESIGRLRRP